MPTIVTTSFGMLTFVLFGLSLASILLLPSNRLYSKIQSVNSALDTSTLTDSESDRLKSLRRNYVRRIEVKTKVRAYYAALLIWSAVFFALNYFFNRFSSPTTPEAIRELIYTQLERTVPNFEKPLENPNTLWAWIIAVVALVPLFAWVRTYYWLLTEVTEIRQFGRYILKPFRFKHGKGQ